MTASRFTLALHLIGVLVWMGGLLFVSRALVFNLKHSKEVQAVFSEMEHRLYWFITVPGAVLAITTGVLMLTERNYFKPEVAGGVWMHLKLTLVAGIIGLQIWTQTLVAQFRRNPVEPGSVKIGPVAALHGIIGMAVAAVIVLVIAKPL